MHKSVLIWDWDNTLVDTREIIYKSQNELCDFYGKPHLSHSESLYIIGSSGRRFFLKRFGIKIGKISDKYWEVYRKNAQIIKPVKGAENLLKWAEKQGFVSIVDSNKRGDILKEECQKLGWNCYFKALVGAEDTFYEKPSKEMALSVLKRISYTRLIVIGDGISDMRLAKNLQAISVFVRKEPPDQSEFKDVHIDFDCKDLNQVKEVLSYLK